MMDTTSEQIESGLNKSDNIEKIDYTSGYPAEESNGEGFDFDDEDLKELNDNSESNDIILNNNNNNNSLCNLNDFKTTELTNSTPHQLELAETLNTTLIKSESNDSTSFNSIANDSNVDKSGLSGTNNSVPEKTTAVSAHHNDIKIKRRHSQQDDFGDDDDDDADHQFVNYLGKVNDIVGLRSFIIILMFRGICLSLLFMCLFSFESKSLEGVIIISLRWRIN